LKGVEGTDGLLPRCAKEGLKGKVRGGGGFMTPEEGRVAVDRERGAGVAAAENCETHL